MSVRRCPHEVGNPPEAWEGTLAELLAEPDPCDCAEADEIRFGGAE